MALKTTILFCQLTNDRIPETEVNKSIMTINEMNRNFEVTTLLSIRLVVFHLLIKSSQRVDAAKLFPTHLSDTV